jgi:outer membrane protein OmpA-like peptidoglycan-associated protein
VKKVIVVAALTALVAACASAPKRSEDVEQARAEVQTLSQDPLAQQAAARDLEAARSTLQQAETALRQGKPEDAAHLAYMARRHAEAGEARVAEAHARQDVASAEEERNRVVLQARTREAQQAKEQLQNTQQQLQQMQAKQTERGMVMTLGDVLFDTGQSTLKPGAALVLDRLAVFLQNNPHTRIIIEGHTDSRGSEEYNEELSQRRAQAVAAALTARGVPPDHYQAMGRGKAYPVATNATPAGRQQNRRVEIVFSDDAGRFAQGAAADEHSPAQRR